MLIGKLNTQTQKKKVPVQRITKYPLLLGRLLRATAQQDVEMREALREAQAKVESYLTAINSVN